MNPVAISPTVAHRFRENPVWFRSPALRAARNFGTSRDVDVHGFDIHGWNGEGVDRAGYSREAYAEDPSLEGLVARLTDRIRPANDPVAPLSKTLPASGVALQTILEAWPRASVTDGISGLDTDGDPHVRVSRSYEPEGYVRVQLSVEPEWPLDGRMWARGLSIDFDGVAAVQALDPAGSVSFGLTVYDGGNEPDWSAVTDLKDDDDVAQAVEVALRGFDPGWLVYAIAVVDGEDGGILTANPISDWDADEGPGHVATLVDGDLICTQRALGDADALERFLQSGRLRSAALLEMLERGICMTTQEPPAAGPR